MIRPEMRKPTREDLPSIQRRSARWYARWLATGLEAYIFEGAGRAAFPGASTWLDTMEGEDIATGLATIGNALSARDKGAFRHAIAFALAMQEPQLDERAITIARKLLRLGDAMRATELYRTLQLWVTTHSRPEAPRGWGELLEHAITMVRNLPVPDPTAVTCLRAIVRQSEFPDEETELVFIALCAHSPEHIVDHIKLLEPRLSIRLRRDSDLEIENYRQQQRENLKFEIMSLISPELYNTFIKQSQTLRSEHKEDWLLLTFDGFGAFDNDNFASENGFSASALEKIRDASRDETYLQLNSNR